MNIKSHQRIIFCLLFVLTSISEVTADKLPTYIYEPGRQGELIGNFLGIYVDESKELELSGVVAQEFTQGKNPVPNLQFSKANVWVRFRVKNLSDENTLFAVFDAPLTDDVKCYKVVNGEKVWDRNFGQVKAFDDREYKTPVYVIDLELSGGETGEYYLCINSYDQIELPIYLETNKTLFEDATNIHFFIGTYAGIMLAMILYNLFVYFTVRDNSYIYYVFYILFVLLTQLEFHGFPFKYVWPSSPGFEAQSIHLLSIAVGVSSVQFLRVFLITKVHAKKLDTVLKLSFPVYGIITILTFLGHLSIAWNAILMVVTPLSLFMLYVGIVVARKGYKPARFFSVAWAIFLIGVFLHAMKNMGILPYNNITVYTMPVGSAIETLLLSFALADRINILKREKEQSQAQALEALRENERIIKEQNIILESKVRERTAELEQSNEELNVTLDNLKSTQSQLVDAEKMASLGQLTAGIAHEINNPINFVTSNVTPLKRDIEDLVLVLNKYGEITPDGISTEKLQEIEKLKKELDMDFLVEEMDMLLKGIDEGAARTSEIIKGLRNFSRLDESELKKASINEGIESTLIVLNSVLNNEKIVVEKELGNLPEIECYPGKLNQLVMNIVNNAIHATEMNPNSGRDRMLKIKTAVEGDDICIKISDNGKGMDEVTKNKIFDPFFTTKDVGQGTGLGLSIAFSIIESHNGQIQVESTLGEGTTFVIKIPKERKTATV